MTVPPIAPASPDGHGSPDRANAGAAHAGASHDALTHEVAERLDRRPWPARPLRPGVEVSFEFFPPQTPAGLDKLSAVADRLDRYAPSFVSVTYGAGGTTQDRTLTSIGRLAEGAGHADGGRADVAGHLTCVGATRDEIHRVLDEYRRLGVTRVVALRGDAPAEGGDGRVDGGFDDAAALVEGIRGRDDGDEWDISVAGYPEVHPKAASASADLEALKRKVDAGADRVLTQFFFDNASFLRFHERCRAGGIDVPVVPGIMPVTNFERLSGFAARCGAVIPDWMPELFGDLDAAPEVRQLVAATVAAEQCRHLVEHGIRQFHFYTMNAADLTEATCRMLGMVPSPTAAGTEGHEAATA